MKSLSMDAVQDDVQKSMEQSYQDSFKQIKSVLDMKEKYFKNLKFKWEKEMVERGTTREEIFKLKDCIYKMPFWYFYTGWHAW